MPADPITKGDITKTVMRLGEDRLDELEKDVVASTFELHQSKTDCKSKCIDVVEYVSE